VNDCFFKKSSLYCYEIVLRNVFIHTPSQSLVVMSNDTSAYHFLYRGGFITLFLCLQIIPVFSQSQPADTLITLKMVKRPLREVFDILGSRFGIYIGGMVSQLDREQLVSINVKKKPYREVLDTLLKGIKYKVMESSVMIISKDERILPDSIITITGRVLNPDNIGLAEVTILEVGTVNGHKTDQNGRFSFRISKTASLKFSYLSHRDTTIKVGDKNNYYITLYPVQRVLNETSVTGYHPGDKRLSTASISEMKAVDIETQKVSNPLQAIEGRLPGVFISQVSGIPGGGFTINIRGQNSLRNKFGETGNSPLYVIDGVPYISEPLNIPGISPDPIEPNSPYSGRSPLSEINPEDISSIEILKDADATAIYGSRGANGVVLITTKKAEAVRDTSKHHSPTLRITASVHWGQGWITRSLPLLDTHDYLMMRHEAIKNDGTFIKSYEYDLNNVWDTTRTTNWQKALIGKTAHFNDQYITATTGNQYLQGLFSFGHNKQSMVFLGDKNNAVEHYTFHGNVNTLSIDKRFKGNFSATWSNGVTNMLGEDLTTNAVNLAPDAPPLYDLNHNLNWQNNSFLNPGAYLERPYRNNTYNLILAAQLSYNLTKHLTFLLNMGGVRSSATEISKIYLSSFNPATAAVMSLSGVYGSSKVRSRIAEPQLGYKRTIGERGVFDGLAGASYQRQIIDHLKQTASGFMRKEDMDNINKANQSTLNSTPQYLKYKYAALFGYLKFNWNNKYLINLSGRSDASSRFGESNRIAGFMSVGAAWIFSGENFIKEHVGWLNFAKLRMSYGSTGSDLIPDYQFMDSYNPTGTQYQGVNAITPSRLSNPGFQWEKNKKLEFALDFSLLKKRISGSAMFFRNRSSNLLVGLLLPPTTGFSSVQFNLDAVVQNIGWEGTLTTINIKTKHFVWTTDLNLTIPQTKLIAFPNLENSAYADQFVVGKSLSVVKLYTYLKVDPATGLYQVEDVNKDGIYDTRDKQYIKDLAPRFYAGIQNRFDYESIHLEFLFYGVIQDGYNYRYNMGQPGVFNQNQPRSILDRWQKPGDHSDVQLFSSSTGSPAGITFTRYKNSSAITSDASFIRLKNVYLSYSLSGKKIKSTTFFLQAQNLITITGYDGLDPETQKNGLPPIKTFNAGIILTF
jgi:TonB-linked SusC/RagA family outer membrane protein